MRVSTIPGPKNRFPGEIFLQVQKDPLKFFTRQHKTYPDIYRWTTGSQQVWVVSEPGLVRQLLTGKPSEFQKGRALQRSRLLLGNGLLTAEGEEHMAHRRMMQPAFRKECIQDYGIVMVEESDALVRSWAKRGVGEVDIHREMMELTFTIISRTMLGISLEQERHEISQALEQALESFQLTLLPFFDLLRRLPFPAVRRFEEAKDKLHAIVDRLVQDAEAKPPEERGILSFLDGVSDQLKSDQLLTILLAGHETTANALTFAVHLLSRHPQSVRKLQEELDSALGQRQPRADDYRRLTYTRWVVEETLRLYPPAWMVGRSNLKALDWDGYEIPERSLILAPQWILHRDNRYFSEPLEFRPQRWADIPKNEPAYFPFGGGARICIGEGFARMEAVLALATMFQKLEFEPIEVAEPELSAGITLRPKHGLKVRVVPRP
jgi:cytochrome P450